MKRLSLILLAALTLACRQSPAVKDSEHAARTDGVEILLFHADRRCPTCTAIERLTREVVENDFAGQRAGGELSMRVIGISDHRDMADRYEVSWSSLIVIRHDGDSERVEDMTRFAFANARTNPERFKDGLKEKITELLQEE